MDDSEIDDDHCVVFKHKQIAGLQVAMNYVLFVRFLQAPADLAHDVDDALRLQARPVRSQEFAKVAPSKKLHHQIWLLVFAVSKLADIEDVDDVRMAQLDENVPFLTELLNCELVYGTFDGLHRHEAILQCDVVRFVDDR